MIDAKVAARCIGKLIDVRIGNADFAAVGADNPGDEIQQRGLARAGRADDRELLAGGDLKALDREREVAAGVARSRAQAYPTARIIRIAILYSSRFGPARSIWQEAKTPRARRHRIMTNPGGRKQEDRYLLASKTALQSCPSVTTPTPG
jgi:hypothetical protein